eukprot:403331348
MANSQSSENSQQNSDIKELRMMSQRSQQQNQNNQSYNLRSLASVSNSSVKLGTHKQLDSIDHSLKQQSNSPQKNIRPFDHKLGKENGNSAQSEGADKLLTSTPKTKGTKTLNLKNIHNQITTNKTPMRKLASFEEDKHNQQSKADIAMMRSFRFETQRINLPRGKVVRCSPQSSANGSKRNSQSPVKLPRNMPPLQDPTYSHNVDYFKEYWRMYFQNETLVSDIEQTAHSNYKTSKKIYNLEDYYEHNLIPQLLTYPHKFLHRLRQQQLQKQQQQQKLLIQQKQQQELLLQMKIKSEGNGSGSSQNGKNFNEHLGCVLSSNNSGSAAHSNNEQSQNIHNNIDDSSASVNGNNSNNGGGAKNLTAQVMMSLGLSKDRMNKRKKHLRRTAAEIEREYICPYAECGKFYGSEGSLNLHIKIKHNGGNKTERERLAKTLVQAYVNGQINKEIETLDLNLPPGALQKAVKKAGLVQQVSENEILRQITVQIQHHTVHTANEMGMSMSNHVS